MRTLKEFRLVTYGPYASVAAVCDVCEGFRIPVCCFYLC